MTIGVPDKHSVAGVAAPSWHTFGNRVWASGPYELELVNLKKRIPTKATTYKVTLKKEGVVISEREGHSWQPLVREMKQVPDA